MDRGDSNEEIRDMGEENEEYEEEEEVVGGDEDEVEEEQGGDEEEEEVEVRRGQVGSRLARRGAGDSSLVGHDEDVRQIHNLRLIAFEEILRLARRFPDEESSDEDEDEEFEVEHINDGYESDIEDNDEYNDEQSISGSY